MTSAALLHARVKKLEGRLCGMKRLARRQGYGRWHIRWPGRMRDDWERWKRMLERDRARLREFEQGKAA